MIHSRWCNKTTMLISHSSLRVKRRLLVLTRIRCSVGHGVCVALSLFPHAATRDEVRLLWSSLITSPMHNWLPLNCGENDWTQTDDSVHYGLVCQMWNLMICTDTDSGNKIQSNAARLYRAAVFECRSNINPYITKIHRLIHCQQTQWKCS